MRNVLLIPGLLVCLFSSGQGYRYFTDSCELNLQVNYQFFVQNQDSGSITTSIQICVYTRAPFYLAPGVSSETFTEPLLPGDNNVYFSHIARVALSRSQLMKGRSVRSCMIQSRCIIQSWFSTLSRYTWFTR